jgi:hypothetical protein
MSGFVDVYSTHGMILVVPIGPVIGAAFTPGDAVRRLPGVATDEELGGAVRASLEDSARLAPRAGYNKSAPEFRASGLRTKAEFKADARLVFVTAADGSVEMRPSENEFPRRPRGGFGGLHQMLSLSVEASDAELGAALRQALASCTFSAPKVTRVRRS